MKLKYKIVHDVENHNIILEEYGELDKEVLSLLCEERFDEDAVRNAMAAGREFLAGALRTQNLYPPKAYADRLAEAVSSLLESGITEPVEILFDDLELLNRAHRPAAIIETVEEESEEIEELLEGDFEEEYEDEDPSIPNINASIKIADDDPVDLEDDI